MHYSQETRKNRGKILAWQSSKEEENLEEIFHAAATEKRKIESERSHVRTYPPFQQSTLRTN